MVNEISKGGKYRYDTVEYGLGEGRYLDATMRDGAWTVTFALLD